jgi:hypothetical protein
MGLTGGPPQLNERLMQMQLLYIGGVIDSKELPKLRKLVMRVTRCNAYVKSFECQVDLQDQLVGDDYDY